MSIRQLSFESARQQGAALFTILFFLPLITMSTLLGWQSLRLEITAGHNLRQHQQLYELSRITVRHAVNVLEAEYNQSFTTECRQGRCLSSSFRQSPLALKAYGRSLPREIYEQISGGHTGSYILEKVSSLDLATDEYKELYRIISFTAGQAHQIYITEAVVILEEGSASIISWHSTEN